VITACIIMICTLCYEKPYHTIPYHTCLKGQDAGNE